MSITRSRRRRGECHDTKKNPPKRRNKRDMRACRGIPRWECRTRRMDTYDAGGEGLCWGMGCLGSGARVCACARGGGVHVVALSGLCIISHDNGYVCVLYSADADSERGGGEG
jgi:hypothetical protein